MANTAPPSSIPGLSVSQVRRIMSEQRRQLDTDGFVRPGEIVEADMSRLQFNTAFVQGAANRRQSKHQRKQKRHSTTAQPPDNN